MFESVTYREGIRFHQIDQIHPINPIDHKYD
jgi:hypothetical protein